MSYATCEDCGSRLSGGRCGWCHEETFIEEQYHELGEPVPEIIATKAAEQREQIARKES